MTSISAAAYKIVRTSGLQVEVIILKAGDESRRDGDPSFADRYGWRADHRSRGSRCMATELSLAQMKQAVSRHFEDFVNRRMADVIHNNMTPGFYDHDGPGGQPTGAEGDEQMMLGMYGFMPDLHLTIEDMIAEGDKVMCRNIWRWTDAASGKRMCFQGFVLWRFEGDKIAERWATVTQPAEVTSWTREQKQPVAM